MIEKIITILIVVLALAYIGRKLFGLTRAKDGCAACGGCAQAKKPCDK